MLLALRTRSQSKSQAHTNAVAPPQPQTENQISPESPGAQRGGEELSDSPPQTSLQGTAHTRQPDGTLDIYEAVTEAYDNEPWFQFEKHTANYIFKDGEWFTQRNQLIVPDMPSIKKSIIHELHSTPIYGHGGFITKTKKQVEKLVWWPSLLKDVTQFVKECPSCQINKSSMQKPAGLLIPLTPFQIPDHMWDVVTMDFIMQLPETDNGHTTLLVVVDKLSKMTHLIPTTTQVTGWGGDG